MNLARLELSPGLWLDARRAVWLEEHRALLVADLHLGYAWAHREQGNLLPVAQGEDTLDRLAALVGEYAPRELVILGDVVHAVSRSEVLADALRRLHGLTAVRFIAGNHDRDLAGLLREAGIEAELVREVRVGPHLLVHGDHAEDAGASRAKVRRRKGRIILGHEHPAISLSDGVTTSARCPCFLVGEEVLVLPAFSPWASGTNVRSGDFLSPWVREDKVMQAIAIVAGKLLPVPLRL